MQLIAHLTKKLRRCEIKQKLRRSVMEFMGIAPNLLGGVGIDAQEYVTATDYSRAQLEG